MSTINLEASGTLKDFRPKSMEFWTQFEGQLLDGQFKLNKYSGQDSACAVFLTELPGQDQFVAAKIVRAASLQAEQLTASWRIAKELQHANLVRVFATGAADLDGLRIVYSVVDYPDATLAQVIQDRSLDSEETRELLQNCAEALQYLHQKGLVHTSVRPASIVAVDKATKLSSDAVCSSSERRRAPAKLDPHDAPEVERGGYSSAADIWSLGLTLFEALKQRVPIGHSDPEIGMLQAPFAEIVKRCLEPKPSSRWTAAQILSFLKTSSSASPEVAAKPQPSQPAQAARQASSPVASSRRTKPGSKGARRSPANPSLPPAPSLSVKPSPPPVQNLPAQRSIPWKNSVALRYVFSAVVVLVCIGWLAKTSVQTDKTVTSPAQPLAQAAVQPTPVQPPAEPLVEPQRDRPSPFTFREKAKPQQTTSSSHAAALSGSANRGRPVWRLVVYTYSSEQSARSKVANINKESPELHAEVLASGETSHMVVLGGKMNRDQASKLRDKLLAQGFPQDSYIQNFPD